MKMRRLLLAICFLCSTGLSAERPNIILIISDDQAWSDFGFLGNREVETPVIDRLASMGLRFDHGYVPSSVCRPSLVTMLTGLYPHQHGIWFNHPPPGFSRLTKSPEMTKARYDELRARAAGKIKSLPTLPRELGKLGYRSLQTGKYWEGHFSNAGFTEGMTLAEPSNAKNGNKTLESGAVVAHGNGDAGLAIGRETMEPIWKFIDESLGQEKPFFVWYAPFLPHTPHDSPERFFDLYRDKPKVKPHEIPYYAAISQFDETVGQIIDFVEDREIERETVFVFVTDNGFRPHPEKPNQYTKHSKRSPFEEGIRTPILIRWTGQIQPERINRMVSSIDLMPTLLKLAGTPVPDGLPGLDLLDEIPEGRAVFGEIYPGDATTLDRPEKDLAYRWVVHRNYKLIMPHGKNPWNGYVDKPVVFDIDNDGEDRPFPVDEDTRYLVEKLNAWWNPAVVR
ncbi:MAG: sulfatase-like hydrolase/transferase [Verrucomicrobiales bacterium]|nr:sulfatase-like hydrolase/transferase [Verrucomicrobiales bacterium]